MIKLFISLPGETSHRIYSECTSENCMFHFVNFAGDKLSLGLAPSTDESFVPNCISKDQVPRESSKEDYLKILEKTKAHLQDKPKEKIVISRAKHAAQVEDAVQLFHKLKALYPNACVYLFTHPEVGTWLGATPELMVMANETEVQSISLAGTRKSGEELSFTAKEEVEQQLVTDYIFNTFESEQGLTDVQQSAPSLQQAGNLFHFKSVLKAKKNAGFDIMAFAQKLHPTPAVGGFPKKESMEFILKNLLKNLVISKSKSLLINQVKLATCQKEIVRFSDDTKN